MATIDFLSVIPTAKRQKAQNCLTARKGYQSTVGGEANPESAYDFANRMIYEWLYHEYEAWRIDADVETARATAKAAVATEF